jgi:hypothetical protein
MNDDFIILFIGGKRYLVFGGKWTHPNKFINSREFNYARNKDF